MAFHQNNFFRRCAIGVLNKKTTAIASLCFGLLVCLAWSADVEPYWRKLGLSQNPEGLLQEILSREEFKESYWWSFLGSLLKWFLELIAKLLEKIFGNWKLGNETEMIWTALGAFFAALLAAGVLIGSYFILRSFISRQPADSKSEDKSVSIPESCSDILKKSLAMADRGEYRDAVIHLFRYALIRLDEQGRLGFYSVKTNREILRSPRLSGSDREILVKMVPIFNCVRYGNLECGKADYEKFLSLTGHLVGILETQ